MHVLLKKNIFFIWGYFVKIVVCFFMIYDDKHELELPVLKYFVSRTVI